MILDKIERTKCSIKRAGSYMPEIMKLGVNDGFLSGKYALALFNTYGITLDIILLIAHSHNISVNEKEFELLLDEQKEISKGMKQCKDESFSQHPSSHHTPIHQQPYPSSKPYAVHPGHHCNL